MRGSLVARAAAVSLAGHVVVALIVGAVDRDPGDPAVISPSETTEVVLLEVDDEVGNTGANDPEKNDDASNELAQKNDEAPASLLAAAPLSSVGSRTSKPESDGLGPPTESSPFSMRDPTPPRPTRRRDRRPLKIVVPTILPMAGPPVGVLPFKQLEQPAKPRSDLRQRGRQFETDGGTFVATTGADGRVRIKDRPNVSVRLNLPDKRLLSTVIRSWQADPYKHATGQSEVKLPTDSIIGGSFDITDGVMRAIGDDPYISKKLALFDRTREERASIAMKYKSESLNEAAYNTKRTLTRILDSALDAAKKRQLYFELWDECAETGSGEVLEASATVRATIVGFVARVHPKGSADAYGKAELAALNKRRTSTAQFSPY